MEEVSGHLVRLGRVSHVTDCIVTVQAPQDAPVVDEGTVVCLENRKVIAIVRIFYLFAQSL
jgi:hypothetical protein